MTMMTQGAGTSFPPSAALQPTSSTSHGATKRSSSALSEKAYERSTSKKRKLEAAPTSLNFAANIMPPGNEEAYVTWAKNIMANVPSWSQSNLPPLLSYIWLPYAQPNSNWSRSWLPSKMEEDKVEPWQIALMYALGASTMDMAGCMVTVDCHDSGYEKAKRQLKARLRKRMDEWRKKHGGLMFRDGTPKKPTKMFESIFTGVFVGAEVVNYRGPLSELQVAFNCVWDIDRETGAMIQPYDTESSSRRKGALPHESRNRHPLFERLSIPKDIEHEMVTNKVHRPDNQVLRTSFPALFQHETVSGAKNIRRSALSVAALLAASSSIDDIGRDGGDGGMHNALIAQHNHQRPWSFHSANPATQEQDTSQNLSTGTYPSVEPRLPQHWHVGGPFYQDPQGNVFAQPDHFGEVFHMPSTTDLSREDRWNP